MRKEIITKTYYARRRGVSEAAVSNWLARGRLTNECLTKDGKIIVREAQRQLRARLDGVRSAANREAAAARRVQPAMTATMPPSARERLLELDLQRRQAQFDAERGLYTLTATVQANRGKALMRIVAAIDNGLPELITELGGDAEALQTARRWWRRLRKREAEAAGKRADALSEFVEAG